LQPDLQPGRDGPQALDQRAGEFDSHQHRDICHGGHCTTTTPGRRRRTAALGRRLIRLLEARGERAQEQDLFGPAYLLRRPLLEAIDNSDPLPPVLLIDEIDRSDAEFEAYLLEVLSDFQISIPEIGTIRALHPPVVVITSNRTREVHDALKRRCLYHWIEYPTLEREYEILTLRVPGLPDRLARQVTAFVQRLRQLELYKVPGIAETLDWAEALVALDRAELEPELVEDTLGALLKVQEDLAALRGDRLRQLLTQVEAGG
jgi:MoxR-like ATPase